MKYTPNQLTLLTNPPLRLTHVGNIEFRMVMVQEGIYVAGAIQRQGKYPNVFNLVKKPTFAEALTAWNDLVREEADLQGGGQLVA